MNLVTSKLAGNHPIAKLVQPDQFIGFTYRVSYESMSVLTNDHYRQKAGGIPHNAFLVAAQFDPQNLGKTPIGELEVYLLRVADSEPLPHETDLVRMKVDLIQGQTDIFVPADAKLDHLTQNEVQYGALKCTVLGTFYVDKDSKKLTFGRDLEDFEASARLRVFRPTDEALKQIVNIVDPIRERDIDELVARLQLSAKPQPIRVGTVRYTSSARRHRGSQPLVPVHVQPIDFFARRTAMFGMSRTGKSNAVKTIVGMTHLTGKKCGLKIGQLIYDLNGEYANANQIDKGAIATVFGSDVVRYRMMKAKDFEPLQNNFYRQLAEGHRTMIAVLREAKSMSGADLDTFAAISFSEPDTTDLPDNEAQGLRKRWKRKAAIYRVLLYRAGFEASPNSKVYFEANQNVRTTVASQSASQNGGTAAPACTKDPTQGLTLDEAVEWFTAARTWDRQQVRAGNLGLPSSTAGKPWFDEDMRAMLNMLTQANSNGNYINGFRALAPATSYHSPRRAMDVGAEIYKHLTDGKIVIIDLSVGNPDLKRRISDEIAQHIFRESAKKFNNDEIPPTIMIYIEEAHNLLGKEADLDTTWPRLAKEGSKFRIGMVYATQEVSSMHHNILANTENFFITHLNNRKEIKVLSDFNDFEDFDASLLNCPDVGFARVKTLSNPFVIPVQIDRFDPQQMQAMVAAGAGDNAAPTSSASSMPSSPMSPGPVVVSSRPVASSPAPAAGRTPSAPPTGAPSSIHPPASRPTAPTGSSPDAKDLFGEDDDLPF